MKKYITLLFVLIVPLFLNAQKAYRKFSIGIGTGYAYNHGDLPRVQPKEIYMGNLEYFISPYIVGNGEFQIGSMAAREIEGHRYFRSNFGSVTGNIKMYMGLLMDKFRGPFYYRSKLSQVLQGIYIGGGSGIIKSYQKDIYREKDNEIYRGWDTDRDVIFPVSVGIDNSSFNSRIITGIRYQYNFGMGDNMDGYAIRGSGLDMFSTISVSVKYRFGRQANYFH